MTAVERELTLLVLPGGAPLFRQGEPADAVYVVASGCLGVFRHEDEDSADEPLLMAEIPPGNIVGEMSLLSHGQRTRSVAALRDSEVWRLARGSFDKLTARHPEVLPTLMRSVAVRNAMGPTKRRRQPRTFAILPTGASTPAARFAVMLAAALGRIGSQVQMLGPESMDRDPEWFARCRDRSLLRALSRRSHGDRMDRALPAPGRLPGRGALGRRRPADPPALRDRDGAVGRRLPSPPRAGAAARGPRSQAGLDGADAGRRPLRPASSRAARHPRRRRPAGAPADRACRRRRHGGRRGARLHPYRRRQGAARVRRADRPGRRHQHGRHRGGERRLALGRR